METNRHDLTGRTLGQYQLHEEIGHGGMASVYRATQTSIGRTVAVKVLPAHFLQDRTFLERFTREVRVIAELQHPRILPVYDFGEQDNMPYIVMAHMEGGTLADRIARGPMPIDQVVHITAQIAEGLDHAHHEGVIHRDFKPSNVLLDKSGNVHLSDFGIAKVSESTVELTASNVVVGTPSYMAPEMSRKGKLTNTVDIYALGVTLYQMLAGRMPFEADTPIQFMMAHVNEPVPDVRIARPDLPGGVQAVIEKAMAKSPKDRYATAGEMARALALAAAQGADSPLTQPMAAPQPDDLSAYTLPMGAANSMTPMSEATPMDVHADAGPPAEARKVRARKGGSSVWIAAAAIAAILVAGAILGGALALIGALDPLGSGAGQTTPEGDTGSQDVLLPVLTDTPASASPLGDLTGRIVFTRTLGADLGSSEIYVLSLPDGSLTRLTTNDVPDWIPHWSPDGESIAFTSFRADNYDIWTMNADGSGPASRIALPAWDDYPVWSPDGTQIAFASTGNTGGVSNSEIFVGSGSGDARRVTTNTGRDEWPAWSPDGMLLANASDRDGDMAIYLVAPDGGSAEQWTDEPGYDDQPDWSPDGEWIAFVRKSEDANGDGVFDQEDDTGYGDIWVGRRDGSQFRQLTFDHRAAHPAWSPDGQHVVFARFRDLNGNDSVDPDDGSDLWAIPAAGGDPIIVLQGPERDWAPDWAAP